MATTIDRLVLLVEAKTKAAQKSFNQVDKSIKKIQKSTTSVTSLWRRWLGLGLGMLFLGMALKRMILGFMRSSFEAFTQMVDVQDEQFQRLQQLRAAWVFFKFAIVDAFLSSEFGIFLVDMLKSIADWLGQLSPAAKAGLGQIVFWSLIGASAMVIFGQGLLFIIGLAAAFQLGLAPLILAFSTWVAVLLLATVIVGIINSKLPILEKLMLATGIAGLIAGLLITGPFGLILFLTGLAMLAMVLWKKRFGSWKDAAIAALFAVGQAIVKGVLFPITSVLRVFSFLLRLFGQGEAANFVSNMAAAIEGITIGLLGLDKGPQPERTTGEAFGEIVGDVFDGLLEGIGGQTEGLIDGFDKTFTDQLETQTEKLTKQLDQQLTDMKLQSEEVNMSMERAETAREDQTGLSEEQLELMKVAEETQKEINNGIKELVDLFEDFDFPGTPGGT